MIAPLRMAITADLHWGHRKGAEATRQLAQDLHDDPPDLFVLAGDIGTGPAFVQCLELFADLPCQKALVPGNHDLWITSECSHDSLGLYQHQLPQWASEQGFLYLDQRPLYLPRWDVALVGSVNWYDYSWSLEALKQHYPGEEHRLHSKRFSRGRHNDANFIRWPLDDAGFTSLVTTTLQQHLREAVQRVGRVIVVTHHPPIYALSFPHSEDPISLDGYLWDAFAGNLGVEQLLQEHASQIAFAFCGHTHLHREVVWEGIRGYNIGSDYHFKRLLRLNWPASTVEARIFQGE
jgi:predicted phosphohydrolase